MYNLIMNKKLQSMFQSLLKHELVSGSAFIFTGALIGNFLAFILNLFYARKLSYADYAIFASLASVITLAAIPAGSISTVIVKFATKFFVEKQDDKLKNFYILFFKFMMYLSLFMIVFFIVFSGSLRSYLHIENIWYVIVLGFVISSFYLNTLNMAFLQSMLKFKFIAILDIIGSIFKLTAGVALVLLGYKVFGGLGALFAMAFGSYLVAYFPLLKIFKSANSDKKIALNINEILFYAAPTFLAILFMTSFTSTDIILVKHFFSPQMAGFYSGLSLIGRVIFYFTGVIPTVMFPLLIKRHAAKKNFNNLFYLALFLVLIPSVSITLFYFVFPNFAINLFLGGRGYLSVSGYLGLFGIYLTVFSLVNVCVNFFLSFNKTNVSAFVVLAAVLQVVLIYIFHANFYQVIFSSLAALSILLIILLYLFFRNYGSSRPLSLKS